MKVLLKAMLILDQGEDKILISPWSKTIKAINCPSQQSTTKPTNLAINFQDQIHNSQNLSKEYQELISQERAATAVEGFQAVTIYSSNNSKVIYSLRHRLLGTIPILYKFKTLCQYSNSSKLTNWQGLTMYFPQCLLRVNNRIQEIWFRITL